MLIRAALARLFATLVLAQGSFTLYWAALPLYFAALGFDPTLIGLLIASAGIAELGAALIVGPAIDRLGGRMLLLVGIGCYLVASLGFLAFTAVPALFILRLIQGFGLASVLSSGYSFVPHLVRSDRQTTAFASLGAANNIGGALAPPLGLTLLQLTPNLLFGAAAGAALLAMLIASTVPPPKPSRRPFGLSFQLGWLMPLLVGILSVIQWGVITAFLPLAAVAADANPSLLFTVDAIVVLVSRVPAGWIADRYGPLRLALVGVIAMAASPLVLLLPLTDAVLIAAGALNGLGAGLTLPPMLGILSQRSDDSRRGSALAYFSVSFALGIIIGSGGGGLAFPWLGFSGLLSVGGVLCLLALAVLLVDARLMGGTPAPVETGN